MARGTIRRSIIHALLKKNPTIKLLHLDFDFTLAPFTFDDIKEISISNREFNHICIEYEDLDMSCAASTPTEFLIFLCFPARAIPRPIPVMIPYRKSSITSALMFTVKCSLTRTGAILPQCRSCQSELNSTAKHNHYKPK
jgi:hypothetical protein